MIVNAANRLDSSDAHHVQCLHTNRALYGSIYACGHSDYYFNMGFKQPGCIFNICDHMRATYIFEASTNPKNAFVGVHCDNDFSALFDNCNTALTDRVGIFSNFSRGRFYVKTTDCYPYCLKCRNQTTFTPNN